MTLIEIAELSDKMGKDIQNVTGLKRDRLLAMSAALIAGQCEAAGVPGEVGGMILSNSIRGSGINHNVRILRDARDGKEVRCGMCPACKAADAKKPEVQEEEIPHELVAMLSKMFGAENITVIRVDNSNNLPKTRH
jgi:hypothetical protein